MNNLPPEFTYQGHIRSKVVRLMRTGVLSVPGSGKTRPIIDAMVELCRICPEVDTLAHRYPFGPILILCSGPAIATWMRQIPEWTDTPVLADDIVVVRGDRHKRVNMWEQAHLTNAGIFITNFSVFLRDFGMIGRINWGAVLVDEYHKAMRRKRKNKTYAAFIHMTRHTEVLVMASGSALRKDPSSMFTLFQAIKPRRFTSYWKFVNAWCIVSDGHFGKEILGPRNVDKFRELVDREFAYIPKEVVADQLPEGRRMPLAAEMTPQQEKVYNDLRDDMLSILESGEIVVASNVLTKIIRLRQLLCCPKILDEALGMGGGYEAILDRLEEDPHCVIFVPFRPACDYIYEDLTARGYSVSVILGGVSPEDQVKEIEQFRRARGIMVCTIAYAESFDLETCKTSYFLGYDYSLDINEQAEGRTRRAISIYEFVSWHYIKYLNTIDEHFLKVLDSDARNVHKVLNRSQELIAALKGTTNEL